MLAGGQNMHVGSTSRKFVLLLLTALMNGKLLATPAIQGTNSGHPGDALPFRLVDGTAAVTPDAWHQGFNPDRYTGTDYASSFDVQLTPQSDGSVVLTASAPGRYRLVATLKGQSYQTAVLISPLTPRPAIRGLDLTGGSEPPDQAFITQKLDVASHLGINWVDIPYQSCIDFDSGSTAISSSNAGCSSLSDASTAWLIGQAHQRGWGVSLQPQIAARQNGSAYTDLQFYITPANAVQLANEVIAFTTQAAALAQANKVEALFVGTNYSFTFVPSATLGSAVSQLWTAAMGNLRQSYTGKLWLGWFGKCGANNGLSFPFQAWNLVDGLHKLGPLPGSGNDCPTVEGLWNVTAADMSATMSGQLSPSGPDSYPFFQLQAQTGLPILWTDFYTISADGINFSTGYAEINASLVDTQELVDFFEAFMQTNPFPPGSGFLLWGTDLTDWGDKTDLMYSPALLHAAANWFGGDPQYFEACLTPATAGVLFQSHLACPASEYAFSLNSTSLVADHTSREGAVLHTDNTSFSLSEAWGDFNLTQLVRLQAGGSGGASVSFRIPLSGPYSAYNVTLSSSGVYLSRYDTSSSGGPTFGSYNLSASVVGQWVTLGVIAAGPHITVQLNGVAVIDKVDPSASPLLTGTTMWSVYGGAVADWNSITAALPPPSTPAAGAPAITGVVNAASFVVGPGSPGEVVTLFGANLGPSTLAGTALTTAGLLSSQLGGAQVLVNGVAAPLIYAQAGQTSAILPYGLTGSQLALQVAYGGQTSAPFNFPLAVTNWNSNGPFGSSTVKTTVGATAPGIFTYSGAGYGLAAALNQDGSYNTSSSPAPRGTTVSLYLTGQGELNPPAANGAIPTTLSGVPAASVGARVGHLPAQIAYAGVAPFLTNGVIQVNIVIPATTPVGSSVPLMVSIGNYVTQPGLTIAVR